MGDLIAMFFCGFFCAAAIMAIVIVSIMFKEDDRQQQDLDQLSIWDADYYGKDE